MVFSDESGQKTLSRQEQLGRKRSRGGSVRELPGLKLPSGIQSFPLGFDLSVKFAGAESRTGTALALTYPG